MVKYLQQVPQLGYLDEAKSGLPIVPKSFRKSKTPETPAREPPVLPEIPTQEIPTAAKAADQAAPVGGPKVGFR